MPHSAQHIPFIHLICHRLAVGNLPVRVLVCPRNQPDRKALDHISRPRRLPPYPQVTHAIRYPAAVLSLGLSPDCATLAVGMANGLLSVKRHVKPPLGAAAAAGDSLLCEHAFAHFDVRRKIARICLPVQQPSQVEAQRLPMRKSCCLP